MLEYSQFNHLVQVPGEDAWALANFRHGTVVKLDSVQKTLLDMAPLLHADVPFVRVLQQGGFLVDEGVDEVAQIRDSVKQFHYEFSSGAQKRSLEIVVAVTSACNFACPYCFQYRRGGHMAPEVRDALVRFVDRRLAFPDRGDGACILLSRRPAEVSFLQTIAVLPGRMPHATHADRRSRMPVGAL